MRGFNDGSDAFCCDRLGEAEALNDEVCVIASVSPSPPITIAQRAAVMLMVKYIETGRCPFCGAVRMVR